MLKRCLYTLLLLLAAIIYPAIASAQDAISVDKAIKKAEVYYQKLPAEKLYLQFDKPYYTAGDTLWFKAWLLNAADYQASASIKLYVDLMNDSNRVVHSMVVPVTSGLAQGDITLNNDLTDGSYTIRAYTNWMQNFGEEQFFNKRFFIGNQSAKINWLVNEQHSFKTTAAGSEVAFTMQLKGTDNMAIPYRDIELRLMENNKTIDRRALITSPDGAVNTTFTPPVKTDKRKLTIIIIDKIDKKGNKISFPFYPEQNIDLQFMPEGGSLVAGLANKVAFKAIGDNGLGVDISGTVVNAKGQEVTVFKTQQNGMGIFLLLPQAGEKYTAKFSNTGGQVKTADLPTATSSGIVMRVNNGSNPDSAIIKIMATDDVAKANVAYTLIAQSKNVVHFGSPVKLNAGFFNIRVAKKNLPTGIISFILLDDKGLPLNERRIFIDNNDRLAIELNGSHPGYQPKDSVALNIRVTDNTGRAVMGNFTVAVTDNKLVENRPNEDNLVSRMLLTSELKGNVESPGWYFANKDMATVRALDILMLAQGWTGYDWKTLPPTDKPKFEMEVDNHISGKMLGLFNKPSKSTPVKLFASSKKYGLILMDTITNHSGLFDFTGLPLTDTIAYTIKAHNKKGGEIGVDILLNIFTKAPVPLFSPSRQTPWFISGNDSLMLKYFKRPNQPTLPSINPRDIKGKLLNEVVVKSFKPSIQIGEQIGALLGEYDEKELITQGKKSLMELLRQKFPGIVELRFYSESVFDRPKEKKSFNYCYRGMIISDVYVDGQSVQKIHGMDGTGSPTSYYEYLKMFFNYIGADDIKGLQLIRGTQNMMSITTRSGAGVFSRTSPGSIAYRPIPMSFPRDFYRPRYPIKPSGLKTDDNRTTIHWEPNVVTDSTGKAVVSFYAADKSTTYTVIIEGTDMVGHFGFQSGKLTVSSKASANK